MVRDEQFGPLVVLGFGGVHVEALADVVFLMPPFDAAAARRAARAAEVCAPLLDSRASRRPLAIDDFCEAAARFSAMVAGLADELQEIDVNPVIVHAGGCIDRRCAGGRPARRRGIEQK